MEQVPIPGDAAAPAAQGRQAAAAPAARPDRPALSVRPTPALLTPPTSWTSQHVRPTAPRRSEGTCAQGPSWTPTAGPPSQQPTATNAPQDPVPAHLPGGGAITGLPPRPPHPPQRRGLAADRPSRRLTISLVGYPIIATGLLLYQPAGWPGFGPCSAAAPPSSVPSTSAPAVVEVFTQVPTPDPTSCNGRPGSAPARSQPVAGRMTRRVVAFWVWTCSPSTDAVVPAPFSYKQDEDEGPERTSDGWPPATAHLPPEVNAADAMNTSSTPMQRPDAACGPLIVLDANPRYFTVASDARPSTSPTPTSGTTPQDAMGPGAITFYRSTVANFRAPAEPSDPTVLNLRKVG